jgi:hypothetical protein
MNLHEWLETLTGWQRGYFPLPFVGIWILASFSLAVQSGWWRLAYFYKAAERFDGPMFMAARGHMGEVSHRGTLNAGATAQGLHLAVFLPFRLFHPPLFILWSDVQARFGERSRRRVVVLEFRQVPDALLEISETLATSLAETEGSGFHLPESAEALAT